MLQLLVGIVPLLRGLARHAGGHLDQAVSRLGAHELVPQFSIVLAQTEVLGVGGVSPLAAELAQGVGGLLPDFIFVHTNFVQNGKCSPFLELAPTL